MKELFKDILNVILMVVAFFVAFALGLVITALLICFCPAIIWAAISFLILVGMTAITTKDKNT